MHYDQFNIFFKASEKDSVLPLTSRDALVCSQIFCSLSAVSFDADLAIFRERCLCESNPEDVTDTSGMDVIWDGMTNVSPERLRRDPASITKVRAAT